MFHPVHKILMVWYLVVLVVSCGGRALPIPEQMQLFKNSGFCYNDSESQNIWLRASHCEDVPEPVIPQLCQPG